jgi:hypothetical protein
MNSAFREIAWLSFPGPDHWGLLLMLAAYFDDSGTHDNSRVVVWGGFMGTIDQWSRFDGAWRSKLKRPLDGKPPLRKFSLAECDNGYNEFASYSRAERDLLQNEMRRIIVENRLIGVAFAVDCPAWERIASDEAKAHFGGDAEALCFSSCFNAAIERAERLFPDESMLSLHFDQGRRSPKLEAIIDRVLGHYKGLPTLETIAFNRVETVTPLQAADVIATESYWCAESYLRGDSAPRPHLKHFLGRVSAEGFVLDEPHIRQTLKEHGFA